MDTLIVLQQMIVIAVLVAIGYMLYYKKAIDSRFLKQLSFIVANVTNPALILSTVINNTAAKNKDLLLTALLIAAVIYAILCVLGVLIPRLMRVPQDERKFYNLMTVYTNTGFIGIPLSSAILPSEAMIYVVVFNIMFAVFIYTHGLIVLGGKEKSAFRKMINPGTVMAVIALIVYWFDLSIPLIPANIVTYIGNATTFLTMTMLGASIAQQSIRRAVRDRHAWIFVAVRMLIVPAVFTWLLMILHVNRHMIMAYCVMLALPAANLPLILAEKENYPTEVLARGILVTTLASFFTITLLLTILF